MVTILQGDCIEKMRGLPPESVHLIVTSPPYWGLRDYGLPPSIWPESEEAIIARLASVLPSSQPLNFSTSQLP
jgi:hypothetical protein